MVSSKHNILVHFPKERNCYICWRTKITIASCRRRTSTVVPREENVGDFKTADYKVLSEGCESGNKHRYAVVATQWIQSYPCKTKTSQGTEKSSWIRRGNQKSFTLTIHQNLTQPVKIFLGIIVRQHFTVQKQMGLLREQCAE